MLTASEYSHVPCQLVLHHGSHLHSARPTKIGGRTNLRAEGYTVPKVKFPISRNEVLLSSCYHPKALQVSCKENNNHRRNPDFSRNQKGSSSSSSSRGRNRHYQGRKNSDNQDETDPLTSKNGSVLSLSSNQRHSATSTPGRREKEIVELFRKVQAQLRERAAIKEERKIDSSLQQGQQQQQRRQGDRGTVDSLLNLLRKHSVAQSKKGAKEDFNVDEPEKIESVEEEHSSTFLSTNSINPEPKPEKVRSVRPASSFRRRSPIPRVKFQPVFMKSEESGKLDVDENEQEFVSLKEIDDIISEVAEDNINEDDHHDDDVDADEDGHDDDEIKEENGGETTKEIIDIASLKLTELKEIAKSRGLKGYSKMKKNDLIELLSAVDS